MKFAITKDVFEEALSQASRFTSTKLSANQAISGCLIKAEKGIILITTTNLNDFFVQTLTATIKQEGEVVVDLKKLTEFLHFLPTGEVQVEQKDQTVLLTQGKTKGTIQTFNLEEFPQPPKTTAKKILISKDNLSNIGKATFAASKDEARPILTGTLVANRGKKTVFVSTDGFRLSFVSIDEVKELPDIIIPAWILEEAVKMAQNKKLTIEKAKEENLLKFTTETTTLYSRLLDGEFPPFEKVIPENHTTQIVLKKEDLFKGVRLASVFARDQADVVILNISKTELYITPKGQKRADSAVFVETEKITGENLNIAFNYKYILDFLNNTDSEEVVMEFTQSTAPGAFKEKNNKPYIHIIMPLRTEETTPD